MSKHVKGGGVSNDVECTDKSKHDESGGVSNDVAGRDVSKHDEGERVTCMSRLEA